MTFIVNLYGAPGAGKSTMRAGLFHNLKMNGYNVEEVTEYAKDLTWEDRKFALACQPYIYGKQLRNVERLMGKVEAIITDSPLLLSYFYAKKYTPTKYTESFFNFVAEQSLALPGINFYLPRAKKYNPIGRNQTESQSDEIAAELLSMLSSFHVKYQTTNSLNEVYEHVVRDLDFNRSL